MTVHPTTGWEASRGGMVKANSNTAAQYATARNPGALLKLSPDLRITLISRSLYDWLSLVYCSTTPGTRVYLDCLLE